MSRAKGNLAEDKACKFLSGNGFTIIQRNFYSRFGEIDIITSKDGIFHFHKFIRTVHVYLKKNNLDVAFMIDAVIVTPKDIDLLENITL